MHTSTQPGGPGPDNSNPSTPKLSDTHLALLLTVGEVQQQTKLSRSRIYELMADGSIRSVKIGRSRRVPHQALLEFVESLTTDSQHGEE